MKCLVQLYILAWAASLYAADIPQDALSLWYWEPAKAWVEALPVGNGRLGAMDSGGVGHERIQFNESTVWTGEPHSYAHPGAHRYLGQIRALLFQGKQAEAEKLASEEFMSIPLQQKAYQAFGDVVLDFPGIPEQEVSNYRRSLNLDTAVSKTTFEYKGVTYTREVFASFPAQVVVIHLSANRPDCLNFSAALQSAHKQSSISARPVGVILMTGGVEDSIIRFEARLIVKAEGGKKQAKDGKIFITGANAATLILTAATNYKNFRDVTADPVGRNNAVDASIYRTDYSELRRAHIADHQRLFRRVSLDLGTTPSAALPTAERIRGFSRAGDPQLVTLLFQFGRYLMIASSREGGQPANLQGIWNDSNDPPWDSKYTVNINTEMNYWPVEETNLSECQRPLFAAMKDLAVSGALTAHEQYNARGWVLHHNFDLWRGTAPINASNHGIWQTGGAWLSTHLWEHYLFTLDKSFLRETAYPLMKGAALFFVDALVPDPKTGFLITGPSNSPEQGGLVMGPTMDCQIVRSLFGQVIAASTILGIDTDLRAQLSGMRQRIAPNRVGRYGQLQEWLEDRDDPKNEHRHVSHLWAVYPGSEITPYGTPELFKASRQSLIFRGDRATGWSMGWKVNLWARFLDGDHAYRILQNLVQPAANKAPGVTPRAGLFPNLLDAHPPFQIDGNFGVTAGITEMLLQSQDPYAKPAGFTAVQSGRAALLSLLPALPAAFREGQVRGLRARGGLEVSIAWKDGKLQRATFMGIEAKPVKVRYAGKEIELNLQPGKVYSVDGELSELKS